MRIRIGVFKGVHEVRFRYALSVVAIAHCFAWPVHAYEPQTHRLISGSALVASVLAADATVLQDLGLKTLNANETFPDASGRTIDQLIRDGAEFEDSGIRPRNHFYNPLNNTPLTIPGIPLFNFTSPDWALEDNGQITGVLGVGSQNFSFADARGYLFQALTSPSEDDRKANFGLVFQTLGQVIHHIQDMAQPQHVRNDPHWDQLSLLGLNPLFNPSAYEKWTDRDIVRNALPFSGYAPLYSAADRTTFNVARNLWHTPDGKGLADFTNRNFVSAGTNFDKPGLFPSPIPSSTSTTSLEQLCLDANPPCPDAVRLRADPVTFFGNTVRDNVLGPIADKENPRASTYSIFDQDLIARGGQPVFSLNRFNFQAAYEFLIPRAVAYSAGMINYFFRGKIDLVPDDANPGTYLIKNLGSEDMSGTFSLYYDDAGDNRILLNNASLFSGLIAANGTQPVGTLPDPTTLNPAPKNPGEYMLVFNGNMGNETTAPFGIGAVVGKAVKPAILIWRAYRLDNPLPEWANRVEFEFFLPQNLAQRFISNPAGISVQLGGVTVPAMIPQGVCSVPPCVQLESLFPFQGGDPNLPLGDFMITQDNAFRLVLTDFSIFSGSKPSDLGLISRDSLCTAYEDDILATKLIVWEYNPALSFGQYTLSFEGKVVFEFVVSPPSADGSVVLTNVKGARLTDVTCGVSIQ